MDIFISYSSKDTEFAKKICAVLNNKGYSYWIAYENECFGEQYAATIINEIENSKIVLILVSKNSNESTHVINEINAAVMRNKKLLPIIMDDVTLSPAMEYYLASHHYLYATSGDFYTLFTNRLATLFGNPTQETPKDPSNTTATPKQNPVNPQPQQVPYNPQPHQIPYNPQYVPPRKPQKSSNKKWLVPLIVTLVVLSVIGTVVNSVQKKGKGKTTETTRESVSIEVETKKDIPVVYEYTRGEIVNNTYINEWANLEFALGDTWIDKSQNKAFDDTASTEYGLVVGDSSGTKSVCIGFEKLTGLQTAITEKQYINSVAIKTSTNFDTQGIANEYSDCFTTDIAGQEYQAITFTLYNGAVTEQILVRKQGDYVIWFVVYGESPSVVTEILDTFEPVS